MEAITRRVNMLAFDNVDEDIADLLKHSDGVRAETAGDVLDRAAQRHADLPAMKDDCEPGELVVVSGGCEARPRSAGLTQKGGVIKRVLPRTLNRNFRVHKVTGSNVWLKDVTAGRENLGFAQPIHLSKCRTIAHLEIQTALESSPIRIQVHKCRYGERRT